MKKKGLGILVVLIAITGLVVRHCMRIERLDKKLKAQTEQFNSQLDAISKDNYNDVQQEEIEIPLPKIPVDTLSSTGKLFGHEYVDMGLSVKWATCNVGATSPQNIGSYYAWSATALPKKNGYNTWECPLFGKIAKDIGGTSYDAARKHWGGTWRLPTKAEIDELIENTTSQWVSIDTIGGVLLTSKINGNRMFFPAGGYKNDDKTEWVNSSGTYWSSTPVENESNDSAYLLEFTIRHFILTQEWARSLGFNIRGVSE